jgi:nitrile hydratase accessory protein
MSSMATPPSISDLQQVPAIPLDADGAVFNSPWEAKVFAMVVSLHQQGYFAWTEWAATISDEIERDKGNDPETPYYELWLRAAERIIDAKGLCAEADMHAKKDALLAEQHQAHEHPHDHSH